MVAAGLRFDVSRRQARESSVEYRLRGCPDDAVAALGEVLASTPAAEKVDLLTRYADDPSPSLRYAAVDALGELRNRTVSATIEKSFRDNSSLVRQRAVEVLHGADLEKGVALLLSALRDEDRWVRESAILQLTIVVRRHPEQFARVAPALIQALDPRDEVVCRSAVHILARDVGKPWRIRAGMSRAEQEAVVGKWVQWWEEEGSRKHGGEALAIPEAVVPTRKDMAPDWNVRCFDGKVRSLRGQTGRVTLLHFWSTWCHACRKEMQELARLYRDFHAEGLDIIGLAVGETSAERVKQYANKHAVPFPIGMAPEAVKEAYGHIHEVPVSVLIDRQGMIRYRWDGERDYESFASMVRRVIRP